jgi:hypothetical protein
LLAILPCPTAPLQPPLNERGAAFPEILTGGFDLAAERDNIDKADVVSPLGSGVLLASLIAVMAENRCVHPAS